MQSMICVSIQKKGLEEIFEVMERPEVEIQAILWMVLDWILPEWQ